MGDDKSKTHRSQSRHHQLSVSVTHRLLCKAAGEVLREQVRAVALYRIKELLLVRGEALRLVPISRHVGRCDPRDALVIVMAHKPLLRCTVLRVQRPQHRRYLLLQTRRKEWKEGNEMLLGEQAARCRM